MKTSTEDLQQQFSLASQLSARLGEVSAALEQAKNIRKQIAERKKDAAGKNEIIAALDALNQKIEVAAEPDSDGELMLYGLALPDSNREGLPRIELALTGLFVILNSADSAPTGDLSTSAKAWNAVSADALARWKNVIEQDIAAANAKLQKANLKPLATN